MDLFGENNQVLRTIGFYQPFCSLMMHGKVETRWVRNGRWAAFPLGKYLGYCTWKFCTPEMLCPNSSGFWFDYTASREDVRFYTIPQLYKWFVTGVKFVLPPLEVPKSLQQTTEP